MLQNAMASNVRLDKFTQITGCVPCIAGVSEYDPSRVGEVSLDVTVVLHLRRLAEELGATGASHA